MADGHERCVRLWIARERCIELGHTRLRATEHIALVVRVARPEQTAIFCDERRLERGRTSIDTQESRATIIFERGAANDLFIVAFVELLQFLVVCEKRGQAHYFRALHIAQVL